MKSVHFICRGNVYRSRMAEAYAASLLKQKAKVKISSSGIEAHRALNGKVDPDTVKWLTSENLQEHLTPMWRQTTQDDIDQNDIVVFMSKTLYKHANEMFKIPEDKARIWEIPDIDGVYPDIKKKVDELVKTEF